MNCVALFYIMFGIVLTIQNEGKVIDRLRLIFTSIASWDTPTSEQEWRFTNITLCADSRTVSPAW